MAQATPRGTGVDDGAVRVEEHGGLLVLRSGTSGPVDDVDDLARVLRWAGDRTVTLVSDPQTMARADFWPRLGGVLDALRGAGHTAVRLAMAGAGEERPGRPALARRVADSWAVSVEAPTAGVHLVPGASLYAPGGWLGFAPGLAPVLLGARCPRPAWEAALDVVPGYTAGGQVIERIPAGLLLRPAQAPATVPGDLLHTVPLDPRRLTVVVGGPPGEEASADDVAAVLSALPGPVRDAVRLAPGGPLDLLPLAQRLADRFGTPVMAATGLPLLTEGPSGGARAVRSVVIGTDGAPGWVPFVNAAECRPGQEPRLLGCAAPLHGPDDPPDGAVRLTDRWQVTVTRAGLWVGEHGTARPGAGLAVDPTGPVVEAGVPGERPDPSLWPALDRLLGSLPPRTRADATLQVHGSAPDDADALRELTSRHGLRPPAPTGGAQLVPYPRVPAAAPAPAVPRTAADPLAVPDLADAWEHLIGGRAETAAPREPLTPDPPAGPDLDEAWEHLSRRPAPITTSSSEAPEAPGTPGAPETPGAPQTPGAPDASDRLTPRPRPSRPDATRPAGTGPARSPFRAGHRSGPAEHTALRLLAGPAWERHAPAVARALTRLPAMSDGERAAAEADLTAVLLHLDDAGGLLDHHAVAAACQGRDDRLLPFASCLVSGLRRLPTHRGAVLRGAGFALPQAEDPETDPLRPGTVLRDRAPLSGVRAAGGAAWPRGPRYAVWSVTGRLARPLFAALDGPEAVPEAAAAEAVAPEAAVPEVVVPEVAVPEVVFAPGTPFMVLDVRRGGPSPVVLLRELPASGGAPVSAPGQGPDAELGGADRAALAGLDEVLRGRGAQSHGGGGWPERCAGPVGEGP
ncbi:hypothetical protein AB0E08_33680 [Streptomyces sp. NPDC048281]|uniref:hypothetical protein n=1 Tax=Streptomyces sp. NPDC048281 TaxID=3154715 RepID=UPI00341609FA